MKDIIGCIINVTVALLFFTWIVFLLAFGSIFLTVFVIMLLS